MARAHLEGSQSLDRDVPGSANAGRQHPKEPAAHRTGLAAEALNCSPATSRGPVRDAVRQLRRSRNAMIGGAMLFFLAIISLAASWVAPYDPIRMSPNDILHPPSARFPL